MADLPPGTVLGNRFEVIGILGYGGMATVYLARDRVREEEVALKVLHDHLARSASMRARLRREVRTAARLSSPHALVAWDLHDLDGLLSLSMPVHRGLTLAEHVQQRGTLSPDALVRLGKELASVLGEAHRLGIVHRDVTPPNVLLDESGASALTDFGLARSSSQQTMTSTAVLGTAGYAAPEVYQGVRTDPRSDLYSLGAVLYFAATGRPPFDAADPMGVLHKQLAGDFVPLSERRPDLPEHVAKAIGSLLAFEPDNRPAEAAAAAARLDGSATSAAQGSRFPSGTWAVDLGATTRADPHALAVAFTEALGHPPGSVPEPPALKAPRFTLVAGIDHDTATRLAKVAASKGFQSELVDREEPSPNRPPLGSLLRSAGVGSVLGLAVALVLVLGASALYLTGPWLHLPPWTFPAASVSTLLYTIVAVLAATLPGLSALGAIGSGPAAKTRIPDTPPFVPDTSKEGMVGVAWLLGTVFTSLPAFVLFVGMYQMVFTLPPLLTVPRGLSLAAPAFEEILFLAGVFASMAAVAFGSLGSLAAARWYQLVHGMTPPLAYLPALAASPPQRGASIVERVQAELGALEAAVRSSDRIPAAARFDLQTTVRQLQAEVGELIPRVNGLQDELRRLDDGRTSTEIDRIEARLARARTLARAGGDVVDLAALERSLAAHLEVLAQADVAEDRLTQLTARLLEVTSLATRCRVALLTDEGGAERARDLAARLEADLVEVGRAVAEVEGEPGIAAVEPERLRREAAAEVDGSPPAAVRPRVGEIG